MEGEIRASCVSCGIFRPLDCVLFSISRSLRRKKVVGPDGPGFEVGGGLKVDLLDFSERVSCGVYMLIAGQLLVIVMARPRRSTVWYQKADYIERGRCVPATQDSAGRYRDISGSTQAQYGCRMQGCNLVDCLGGGRMRWRWAVDDDGALGPSFRALGNVDRAISDRVSLNPAIANPED
jgi:hypothetical protein